MRRLLLTTAVLCASVSSGFANEPENPSAEKLSIASINQPQRVNWENKSDRINISPASARPDQNNFADKGTVEENSNR